MNNDKIKKYIKILIILIVIAIPIYSGHHKRTTADKNIAMAFIGRNVYQMRKSICEGIEDTSPMDSAYENMAGKVAEAEEAYNSLSDVYKNRIDKKVNKATKYLEELHETRIKELQETTQLTHEQLLHSFCIFSNDEAKEIFVIPADTKYK